MSSHFDLPKPADWNPFEDLVCDVMIRRLGCRNLQRYGRNGQRQFGVDIAGINQEGVIGIQCKNHPNDEITLQEIDKEIENSESFRPTLARYIIATSADRDTEPHSHVLQISSERQAKGLYSVEIVFWQDIVYWLADYPDLIHKHFKKYFPVQQPEDLSYPVELDTPKFTLTGPSTRKHLKSAISQTLNGMPQVTPYQVTCGLTTFANAQFIGLADIQFQLSELFEDELRAEESFYAAADMLREFKTVLSDRETFSPEIWIYPNTRLSPAFLFGSVFRKPAGFHLKLIANNRVWATEGLPKVRSDLVYDQPIPIDSNSDEVAVVLNISRNIERSACDFVRSWERPPKSILVWSLPDYQVRTAAHGLSIAQDISYQLKRLIDRDGILHIHLFAAMPAAIATLVTYHLNGICPISIYFMDSTRAQYRLGGTITNNQ